MKKKNHFDFIFGILQHDIIFLKKSFAYLIGSVNGGY